MFRGGLAPVVCACVRVSANARSMFSTFSLEALQSVVTVYRSLPHLLINRSNGYIILADFSRFTLRVPQWNQ